MVLIEASEESGSPDLEYHLDALSDLLGKVELLICLDSGALTYDRLWVTTSLRGIAIAQIRVAVLEQGVHSGSASGVAPSSFRVLRQLLDRIEDAATGDILLDELARRFPMSTYEPPTNSQMNSATSSPKNSRRSTASGLWVTQPPNGSFAVPGGPHSR